MEEWNINLETEFVKKPKEVLAELTERIHNVMAKNGLDKWFAQKWVDIGSKKKHGSIAKCGRSKQKKDAKRKYPKCVPLAKARRMTEGQRRSAVSRKRAVAQGVGGKPTNVKTFTKRAKAMGGGFMARRASYV